MIKPAKHSYRNPGEASYSLNWAMGVISDLDDKHPRATDFMGRVLGFSHRKLAWYLANDQITWRILRDLIKELSRAAPDRKMGPWSDKVGKRVLSSFLKDHVVFTKLLPKEVIEALTRYLEVGTMEEQV
jgi:hypothetical protein